jgi:uncharacterized protein involved in exopolysaccharide biosynthesis
MSDAGGGEVVHIHQIIAPYWRRKWLIFAIALCSIAAFTAVAFWMTPIYRATAILIPADSNRSGGGGLSAALGSVGGLASLAGIALPGTDYGVEETLAVLKSRQFTEPFLVDEKIAPQVFAGLWDKDSGKWKVEESKQPSLAKTYLRFEKMLTVTRTIKTGLITIQIDWKDSAKATHWVNELIRRLNVEMRSRAIARADASVGYLQKEWGSTQDVSTREAIGRLIETQVKQRMLANVTEDYALRVIDRAMLADPSDTIRPNKPLLVLVGMIFGVLMGILVAFVLEVRSKMPKSAR